MCLDEEKYQFPYIPKSYRGFFENLLSLIIFYSLIFGSNAQWALDGLLWRFPKWYDTSHNSKKCSPERQFFEATFTVHKLCHFKNFQNWDFLEHSNGQIHVIGCHWNVFHQFHAKIFFGGVMHFDWHKIHGMYHLLRSFCTMGPPTFHEPSDNCVNRNKA